MRRRYKTGLEVVRGAQHLDDMPHEVRVIQPFLILTLGKLIEFLLLSEVIDGFYFRIEWP